MGNVSSLGSIQSKPLRNSLHPWGITRKITFSPKLLASVALVGFGIQVVRKNRDVVRLPSSWQVCNRRITVEPVWIYKPSDSGGLPLTRKKWKEGEFSFFNSMKSLRLLTPVSCEDVICDCSTDRNTSCPGSTSSCSSDIAATKVINQRDRNECRCPECGNKSDTPPPSKAETTSLTDERAAVSNKSCRNNSRTCSQVSDIDIEALSAQLGGVKQVDFTVDTDLSHCFLIKQASQVTVDSVTRIVTETASAYSDYHEEYRDYIDKMMDFMEASRNACGSELEVLECKIVLIRAKVDEMKRKIADLDMFLGSLEKLGNAAAETAFMANAEYASVAMSERQHSLCTEVQRIRQITKEKERSMLELQTLIIVESGRSLK